jgi:hypothetical protein
MHRVAASRHGGEILEAREQTFVRQHLKDAERERRAANPAARKTQGRLVLGGGSDAICLLDGIG